MGKDDAPKNEIPKVAKAALPFWKSAPPMIQALMVIAVVVIAIMWLNPWKKEVPTSQQTAKQAGTGNTLNQAGGNITTSVTHIEMHGPTEEQQKEIARKAAEAVVKKYHDENFTSLTNEYPLGAVVIGIASDTTIIPPIKQFDWLELDWQKVGISMTSDVITMRLPDTIVFMSRLTNCKILLRRKVGEHCLLNFGSDSPGNVFSNLTLGLGYETPLSTRYPVFTFEVKVARIQGEGTVVIFGAKPYKPY